MSKILVFGAGPIGSLYAARLAAASHDVSLLARGRRLAELREYGIVLEDAPTGIRTVTRVDLVERLGPRDAYDLVLVVMRKNHVLQALPALAANDGTPNVLFLGNNAAGPSELVRALGGDRPLLGFPGSAGARHGHAMLCLSGTPRQKATIPIGEVDGRITERTRHVADILETMSGHAVEIRTDMDAWLKTHVALLMPGLAAALYAAGTDRLRLARSRETLALGIRATREALEVLDALGVPITPRRAAVLRWLPEPVIVAMVRRLLRRDEMEVAFVAHALAARDEMIHLTDEFRVLARTTSVPTPAMDELYPWLRGDAGTSEEREERAA